MASTRTRELARKIQRANPGMKYARALRFAEKGVIPFDPMGSPDALLEMVSGRPLAVLAAGEGAVDPPLFASMADAAPGVTDVRVASGR